MMVSSFAR